MILFEGTKNSINGFFVGHRDVAVEKINEAGGVQSDHRIIGAHDGLLNRGRMRLFVRFLLSD